MSRAGRKRKLGQRTNGRLRNKAPSEIREDVQRVVKDQRIEHHGATPENAQEPLWETALGRLFMAKRKGDDRWLSRYEAGRRYSMAHRRYLSACDAPSTTTCTLGQFMPGKGRVVIDDEAEKRARDQFLDAWRVLKAEGNAVYRVVTALVLSDIEISESSQPLVDKGLDALVSHYRLDGARAAA